MPAVIQINQPDGAGPGTAGTGRTGLWKDVEVELTCPDLHESYFWQLLDVPPDSEAVLDDPTAQTCHYTPDQYHTYRVQLTVDGGGADSSSIKVAGVTKTSTGLDANRGWRFPAVNEQIGESNWDGNDRGYAPDFEAILNDILANAFSGGGGSITLGGDLGAWSPPSDDHQRVIGLNTVALPEALPERFDFLQANSSVMISGGCSDMTYDGTSIWVADYYPVDYTGGLGLNLESGGLARFDLSPGTYFQKRIDFPSIGGVTYSPISVVKFGSYLYVFARKTTQGGEIRDVHGFFLRVDPTTGEILAELAASEEGLQGTLEIYDALLRVFDGKIWVLVRDGDIDHSLCLLDPDTLVYTHVLSNGGSNPAKVDIAFDSASNKVWVSKQNQMLLQRVDSASNTLDLTVDLSLEGPYEPYAIAVGGGFLWAYTSQGYQYYTGIVLIRDLSTGGAHTQDIVLDPRERLAHVELLAYDTTNSCLWAMSNGELGDAFKIELVDGDYSVSAGADLLTPTSVAALAASGYLWVLDAPLGGGKGPKTLQKVDAAEAQSLVGGVKPMHPWGGLVGEYTSSTLQYVFTKNRPVSQNLLSAPWYQTTFEPVEGTEVYLMKQGQTLSLPDAGVDGQRVTVIDANNSCSSTSGIDVYWGLYGTTWRIRTVGGSLTLHWSDAGDSWYVI